MSKEYIEAECSKGNRNRAGTGAEMQIILDHGAGSGGIGLSRNVRQAGAGAAQNGPA
jgi:hypothetical protein